MSIKLHIGCKGSSIPGFKRLDVVQWGDVDFVRDAKDLSCFQNGEVEEIYASHILEHFPSKETQSVLNEWARVLKRGGIAYISVPDFDRAVDFYLAVGRFFSQYIQDWLHGGQHYEKDVHLRSFTFPILSHLMSEAGFSRIDRLEFLPYDLKDCSQLLDNIQYKPISLNVKGTK